MGTVQAIFEGDRGGSDHCACLTRSDVTGSHVTFLPYFSPVLFSPRNIFPYFPPRIFFPSFFSRNLSFPHPLFFYIFFPYFFSRTFFPVLFFPYYFAVLFQKSRRLKSNVLKYQLVVFLVHVVITQFMFLAE